MPAPLRGGHAYLEQQAPFLDPAAYASVAYLRPGFDSLRGQLPFF